MEKCNTESQRDPHPHQLTEVSNPYLSLSLSTVAVKSASICSRFRPPKKKKVRSTFHIFCKLNSASVPGSHQKKNESVVHFPHFLQAGLNIFSRFTPRKKEKSVMAFTKTLTGKTALDVETNDTIRTSRVKFQSEEALLDQQRWTLKQLEDERMISEYNIIQGSTLDTCGRPQCRQRKSRTHSLSKRRRHWQTHRRSPPTAART